MEQLTFIEKFLVPSYDNPEHVEFGRVAIDTARCIRCRLCIRLCPADALEDTDTGPALKDPRRNECMACADCLAFCPEDAIRLIRGLRCNTGRFKALSLGRLSMPRL